MEASAIRRFKMTNARAAFTLTAALLASVILPGPSTARAETPAIQSAANVTHYRIATVDGVSIFYREAGPADGPAVILLHGFPTSSHMFRNLIPALADRYHVIAPDYPDTAGATRPITQSSLIPSAIMPTLWTDC
jgi:hypothetical protein